MSYEIPLIFPGSCKNDTTVAVKYKEEDGGDDDTTTTLTTTISSTVTETATTAASTSVPEPSSSGDQGYPTSSHPHSSFTFSKNATTSATQIPSGPARPSYTHSGNATTSGSATVGPADPPQTYPSEGPTSSTGTKTGPIPTGPAPPFTGAAVTNNVGLHTALGAGMLLIGLAHIL